MTSTCCELTALNEWLVRAQPNDKFIYYTGQSVQDTVLSREVGKQVYKYATRGLVYLVQLRSSGYYFDFDHYLIKASNPPAYSLVPYADEKTEELRKQRGVRSHGKNKRADEEKRQREWWHHPV
jgi:hypothetical protein